ncbi:MAG: protein kinase [Planctomycetota bacterium]|nr:protein kinase [Planctomycetota bacterium]
MKPQAQPGDLPLEDCANEDQAVAFDFVVAYFDDLDAGRQQRLADYLTRFPGHESIVAAEYLRQEDLRGERISAESVVETSDEEDVACETDGEQHLGPYRLLHELGRGGQGSVWLAADTRIQRRVALKLLSGFFITDDRRKRLRREAESVARLAHPGICSVLEAEVEGEQPYIAMQYVPGQDLAASLNAAQAARAEGEVLEGLPWVPADRQEQSRCLHFFERAARALHAAHEADLVHRDIKPGNLIVTPDGEPVLLDFGLAQDLQSVDGLTRSDDLLGTPHYMSPEQLRGEHDETDRRADVYALGVSLFECLAGRRPFEGDNRFVLQNSILMDVLPDPREFNAALDRDVAAVLETALERDPARRYSSALEFAEDLRRIREFEPVHARPAGVPLRLLRWARRQPAVAAATCVTLLSLSIGLGVTLKLLAENQRALDLARGRHFTTRARELTEENPDLALLMGLEAASRLNDHLGRSVLFGPLETCQMRKVLDRPMTLRFWQLAEGLPGQVLGATTVSGGLGTSPTGTLDIWDWESGEHRTLLEVPGATIRALGVRPGSSGVVVGTDDGRLVGLELESDDRLFEHQPGAAADVGQRTVLGIEFAPSGMEFAVQLASGETLRYRYPEGELLSRWSGIPLTASAASYSPDGSRLLVSGGASDAPPHCQVPWVRVFDVLTGQELARIEHSGDSNSYVNWAGWSPEGDRIATAGVDGRVRFWDAGEDAPGQPLGDPLVHLGAVYCAAFSPDGLVLATGTDVEANSQAALWDLESGTHRTLEGHSGRISSFSWSPDGERLASASQDRTVRIWDRESAEALKICKVQMLPSQVLWSSDGHRVINSTRGSRMHVWNAGPMPYAYRLAGHKGPVRWASFLPGGERALTACDDGWLRLWRTPPGAAPEAWSESGRLLKEVELHEDGVQWASLGPKGRFLASVGYDGRVSLFDLQLWGKVGESQRVSPAVQRIALCVQPPRVAILTGEGGLLWFDPYSSEPPNRWSPSGHEELWTHMSLEPGGTQLAAATNGGTLGLLDLATGRELMSAPWSSKPGSEISRRAEDLQWRADGQELALLDGTQRLWSFDHGGGAMLVGAEFAHHRFLWMGSIRMLLGWDGMRGARTQFHDLDTGSTFGLGQPSGAMHLARSSADGQWLVAAGPGGKIDVWSSADGSLLSSNDSPACSELALSSDFSICRVISAGEDGSVRVWPVDPVPAAMARRPRELSFLETQQEWSLGGGR